jgi:hypothetical protein
LGISAQTASCWHARQGTPAKLGPAELAKIRGALDHGAVTAGFHNDLWTLARIVEVTERATGMIERVAGLVYHPAARVVR